MPNDPVFDVQDAPNQSPPFVDRNLFLDDCALRDGAAAAGVDAAGETLAEFGAACGSAEAMELGRLANEFPPRLRLVDARGNRLDQVEFHPAYHALMARSMAAGLHWSIWDQARAPSLEPSGQAARAARLFMATQAESGHICPLTMTSASMAALSSEPAIAQNWLPKISRAPLRSRAAPMVGEERRHARHGHDRAAGRHRRARQHHHGDAGGGRLRDHRRQMVHVCADVRRVSGARPGAGRTDRLSDAALPARRREECDFLRAAEGQARQSLQRFVGSRLPVGVRRARRSGGAGGADDHRNGATDPPRLRRRLGGTDALRARAGDAPRALAPSVSEASESTSR